MAVYLPSDVSRRLKPKNSTTVNNTKATRPTPTACMKPGEVQLHVELPMAEPIRDAGLEDAMGHNWEGAFASLDCPVALLADS